ncbi:hypothetical protein NC652_035118 [Populus alba x Populus x berolinensis]|nr:hypothetical protein NC652_035118 [Populus alba x Populus x berolinensis]
MPGLKTTPLLKLETAAFWCRTQRRTVCLECEAKLLTLLVAHDFGWENVFSVLRMEMERAV